jgi:hypothetical protein
MDLVDKATPARRKSRLKASLPLMISLLIFGGSSAFLAQKVHASSINYGCNWGKTTLTYRDPWSSSSSSATINGAAQWNYASARFRIWRVSGAADISVYTVNAGNTGWMGLTHGNGSGGSPYYTGYTCTPGGTNITRNAYYGANSYQDQNIWTHEFGHAAGLNHYDVTYPCASSFGIVAVMYYGVGFYNNTSCYVTGPLSDDISAINSRY